MIRFHQVRWDRYVIFHQNRQEAAMPMKEVIFILLVSLFMRWLLGKVPFDGENTVAIALMHLRDEITPPRCYFPDIPSSLGKN